MVLFDGSGPAPAMYSVVRAYMMGLQRVQHCRWGSCLAHLLAFGPLQEVHTLLSAAAVALSHARTTWPLLIPVHDAVRDGYRGVAVAAASAGGATLHFDTDSLHTSRLRPGLLSLSQQLLLFARQLGAAGAPAAAAACRAATGAELELPASMAADAAAGGNGRRCSAAGEGRHVELAVRHSYALAEPGEVEEGSSSGDGRAEDGRRAGEVGSGEWDGQAPWRPWAAQADPVGELCSNPTLRAPGALLDSIVHCARLA